MRSFMFRPFSYHLIFAAVKINETVGKIIFLSEVFMFMNIMVRRLLRLCSTDWKSSLSRVFMAGSC